jgi:hypothetical protein
LSRSSSDFCIDETGKASRILITRATRVVSNATPSPPVTLLIESMSTDISCALSVCPENPEIADEMPITVPIKPRIGIAHRKDLTSE